MLDRPLLIWYTIVMSEQRKLKGYGVMAGDVIDGESTPDRYYAIIKHGHLGVYETLAEAKEARRVAVNLERQWVAAYKDP